MFGVYYGPKACQENVPPPAHQQQPDALARGRMDPRFHVYSTFWRPSGCSAEMTHQTMQGFCNLPLSVVVSLWELSQFPAVSFKVPWDVRSEVVLCISWWWRVVCRVTVAFQSSGTSLSVLSHQQDISVHIPAPHWIVSLFGFSVNPGGGCVFES